MHVLRRGIVASSLKILCETFNQLKTYGQTNMNVFVLSLWGKYRWGLIGPGHAETCLMSYANNKGADQLSHPRSLISIFVVRCLDSMIYILPLSKVSRF